MKTYRGNRDRQLTEPRPGVQKGDHVYFQHRDGPRSGRVLACGRHGITADCDGARHNVYWHHVLGHKERLQHGVQVVDQGEDGAIIEHADGRRAFLNGYSAQKENTMGPRTVVDDLEYNNGLGKSSGLVLFLKGKVANNPGLTLQEITDKAGHQTKRWKRTNPDEPAGTRRPATKEEGGSESAPHRVGDSVKFAIDGNRHAGKVVAAGKDGATVRDERGVEHKVFWKEMQTQGGGAQQRKTAPAKPGYAPREEGESDKAYAKRAVDAGDAVGHLPEDHDRYFNAAGAKVVGLDNLHSTKSDDDNIKGGDNGPKRMLAAYHGVLGRRDPITVMPHGDRDGHYHVVDGNGTLESAKRLGWKSLPIQEVDRKTGEAMLAGSRAEDIAKKILPTDLEGLPRKGQQPTDNPDELYENAETALEQLKVWLNKGKGEAAKLGYTTMDIAPGKVSPDEWGNHSGMLFVAKLKDRDERAAQKVRAEYGGRWDRLLDVVRRTIAVENLNDLSSAWQQLQKSFDTNGIEVVQRPKNKFLNPTNAGYRDINLVVRMQNGILAEVQLNVKDMLKAKNEAHPYYETTRKIAGKYTDSETGAQADQSEWSEEDRRVHDEALDRQVAIYGAAWDGHVSKHYGGSGSGLKKAMEGLTILLWKKL